MKEERAEYIANICTLDGDVEGRKMALAFIDESDVWVHGKPAHFPTCRICSTQTTAPTSPSKSRRSPYHRKVIQRYLDDESYRELFHFPDDRIVSSCCPATMTTFCPWHASTSS